MCNLGERLFNEIFDLDAIAELADDKFTREAVYMLNHILETRADHLKQSICLAPMSKLIFMRYGSQLLNRLMS